MSYLKLENEALQCGSKIVRFTNGESHFLDLLFLVDLAENQYGELRSFGLKQLGMGEFVDFGPTGSVQPESFVIDPN